MSSCRGILLPLALICLGAGGNAVDIDPTRHPQLSTSSRLLRLGETITFRFHAPEAIACGDLEIFPRYLEQARPGNAFRAGGDLDWVQRLPRQSLAVRLEGGEAVVTYTPARPGSYLARWQAGHETFYRYFAVIEDDWVVLRFSAFEGLETEPTLHGTGIPLDYRLPAARFDPADALFRKFLGYHRHFGDTIIPWLPDTPDLTPEQRLQQYAALLDRVRALMPDAAEVRSVRLEMRHDRDPGYTRALAALGLNDHCGLMEANAPPWLGMPEFPYFASPIDCRKINQEPGGEVVAHQWDFCGGWHFIGPVSWHFKAAAGRWEPAERCIRQGLEELVNAARLSGHPIFAVPLYDGLVGPGYPNPSFQYTVAEHRAFNGDVAEVFLVDRALSEAEVGRVMLEGVRSLPGSVAAWPLDEGRGRLVGDTTGSIGGSLVGGATWTDGPRGPAVALDGTDGCVRMERPVSPTGTDFTLGCWVRPGSVQVPWANLLSSHNDDGGRNHRGISLEQDGPATNRFYLIGGTGQSWEGTSITTQLRAGEWQHFAVVRAGNQVRHYRNGILSAEGAVGDAPFRPATDAFRVGDWARGDVAGDDGGMSDFVERYQRLIAFDFPKRHRVAFARSLDIADYYRRHFPATPRTVFVSRTDHVLYDMWWLCHWCSEYQLVTRERLPWETRMSVLMAQRRNGTIRFKDPLSYEYVLVEDQRASIRFERECPNPIWWFDYTHQETGPEGSTIAPVEVPDVNVALSPWRREGQTLTATVRLDTAATMPDYAICLWGLPGDVDPTAPVETDAREALFARNPQGETHLILRLDLKPGAEVQVRVRCK